MPVSKTKMKKAAIAAKSGALPKIPEELLDRAASQAVRGRLRDVQNLGANFGNQSVVINSASVTDCHRPLADGSGVQ